VTDAERRAATCRAFESAPYYRHLGMRAESDLDGTSRVRLARRDEILQLYGGIHGGALMSLADAAISIAVATTIAADQAIATVELSIQFLAPPGEHDVVAEGRVTKRGARLCFGECVLTAAGASVARAQGIWHVGSKAKIDRAGSASRG
jgi:acyl-CoA thioesterase